MSEKDTPATPREATRRRLEKDLESVDEADVRSAVFCGEMGFGDREQEYLHQHPNLRCPYMDRVETPRDHCKRLQAEYRAAISSGDQ